ncbi:uncharacterized protein LOC142349481 isoform X2 [Convolutriloba macropyga]|uniref:uncharacterized protein LOC142349481 isoform X2 n=1 Tax=Convolutriloba macropyga TaxID=536237 RepID=UPI003F52799D
MSLRRIFNFQMHSRKWSRFFSVLPVAQKCPLCGHHNTYNSFDTALRRYQSSASAAIRPVKLLPKSEPKELTEILMQFASQKRPKKERSVTPLLSMSYSSATSTNSLADVLSSMANNRINDNLYRKVGLDKEPTSFRGTTLPLSESLKVDSIRLDMLEVNELGKFLYWKPEQIDEALKKLKTMMRNYQSLQDSCERKEELTEDVMACRKLVAVRLCANRSADVYLKLVSDKKKIAAVFDDSNLDLFRDFVLQFEALELGEDFKMSRLSLLLSKFFTLLEKEASFVNLSPQMIQLIESSSINERVSLLDDMARISCRSLTLLSTICGSLAKEENLSRAKLRSICFSLSQLNFYNEDLLTRAADSFVCEVRETTAITPQIAASFLSLCRKMRFKNDLVVNTVATCMLPLLRRLKEDASHDIQKEQDLKSFAEFITSIASLNAQINELEIVPESCSGEISTETTNTLQELVIECVNKHQATIDNLGFFKSLALLGLLTDKILTSIAAKVESVIRIEDDMDSNDSLSEFELFCAHLVLAEGCMLKLPAALELRRKLLEPMKDLVTLKKSRVVLSDADLHVRQFFEEVSDKLGLEFVTSGHIGLGYVADCIKIPQHLWTKIGAKQIVADCPSLSDSVNMFEALRGEKLKQLRHLKQLNSILFIVDPLHWEQLTTSYEKMQYLEAKLSIEFEHILKPHFKEFDFNVVQ